MSRNPETPMRRIRENRTCDLPGPGDSHCTDHPAHDWSCYDARGDVSFNVRQGWTHRHPGCPDDGQYLTVTQAARELNPRLRGALMTADLGPVVKAVETAKALHGGTFAHRLPWSCLCGAIFRSVEDHHEHYRTEVAKAAMDAARPIILREAAALLRREYGSGHAGAVAWIEDRAAKAYEIDADDRSQP